MFWTSCFRSLRAAESSPLCDPKRQPGTSSSCVAARSLQAFVHFPLGQVFRPHVSGFSTPALSRWSAHVVPVPLAPTRLGYGDVSLVPLHVLRRSLSTLRHPLVHVVLCQQPLPLRPELLIHSWSMRRTPLLLSLSPPHFERRCPPSIKYEDAVDHQVFAHSAQSLSEKTSTIGCSACLLYTTKHLGILPSGIAPDV